MQQTEFDKEWQQLQTLFNGNDSQPHKAVLQPPKGDILPLQKLQRNWNYRFIYGGVTSLVWLLGLVVVENMLARLLVALLMVFTMWSLWLTIKLRYELDKAESTMPVLGFLKLNHTLISKALRVEEQVFIPIYPFSIAAGFLIGATYNRPEYNLLENPTMLYILGGTILVLTPLSWALSRWLNNKAFRPWLKNIEDLIKQFE